MSDNILNLFIQACKTLPNKLAIIDAEQDITFEQLHRNVVAKACYFKEQNIQAGDRVLVFIPMSVELYVNVLALFYIGATAVFLDEWVSVARLKLCCQLADCKGIIAGRKVYFLRFFIKDLRNIPVFLNPSKTSIGVSNLYVVASSDSALITFTTGSTGIPKAANRTHGFLHEQFKALLPLLDADLDRVDMPLLPIVLLLNLGIGRTSVIANFKASKPNSFNPKKIVSQIQQHNVSSITTSPNYALQLAKHCQESKLKLPLEKVIIGGAAIYPNMAKSIYDNLSKNTLLVYGSTEAEPITHISAEDLIKEHNDVSHGLCVGEIDEAAKVQIIKYTPNKMNSHQLQEAILPLGEIGEIIVSGPHVLDAYYKNDEAFHQNKIIDSQNVLWHRTGDMGYLSRENNLFLLGRCKQAIPNGSNHLYPFVIEYELPQIPEVQCGTIIKAQDSLVFVLQTKQNAKIEEKYIEAICQKYDISNYKIRYASIPKDPRHNSKIDYEKLLAVI